MTITPEQILKNIAAIGKKHSTVVREHNGRGRAKTYTADTDTIAFTLAKLSEAVEKYLDGTLEATSDESAF